MTLEQRFIRYISYDTQSQDSGDTNPTTPKQFLLGNLLVEELHQLGLDNAYIDEHCYVYAYLPSNCNCDKTIGLIAHLDTATELTGCNVRPIITKNYDGKDIILNPSLNYVLSAKQFPELTQLIGHTIITTDGTTLLGADDKAGIAIIMNTLTSLKNDPSIVHPNIIITFTPDEEVGLGTLNFNVDYYQSHHCDMAYTLDGGPVNVINFENFNAAAAFVHINGKAIHPGSAKNQMINSLLVAYEFHSMLPADMTPSKTEKYEGFNHLNNLTGCVDSTNMHYIIRNHDMKKFRDQIALFESIANYLNVKYGSNTVELTIKDTYYNMRELVLAKPEILEYAIKGIKRAGYDAVLEPIRGGTDGAHLSYKGIITPNLGTGGGNFHGRYEYVSVDNMAKMTEILMNIFKIIIEENN